MTRPRAFATALSLCLAIACTAFCAAARDDTPPELRDRKNPVVGLDEKQVRYYERQFKGKCARCHGIDGAGGTEPVEPTMVAPANLTDAEFMASRSDGQLFHQIMKGGGDRCAMPAFGPGSDHSWTEDKIWHMVAYVRRFATRRSE